MYAHTITLSPLESLRHIIRSTYSNKNNILNQLASCDVVNSHTNSLCQSELQRLVHGAFFHYRENVKYKWVLQKLYGHSVHLWNLSSSSDIGLCYFGKLLDKFYLTRRRCSKFHKINYPKHLQYTLDTFYTYCISRIKSNHCIHKTYL